MIDVASVLMNIKDNPIAWIAIAWTVTQELRFWKLCASCPYKENYKEKEKKDYGVA